MTIAVANKKKMYVGLESPSAWATPPLMATAGLYTALQYMSDTIEQSQAQIESRQITPTRDLRDTVRDQISAIGAINHEYLAGNTDMLISAALRSVAQSGSGVASTKNTVLLAAGSCSAAAIGNTFTATFTATAVVGRFISVKGFTKPQNNGIRKVLTATTGVITTAGKVCADEGPTAGVTVTHMGYYALGEGSFDSFTILMNYSNIITPVTLHQYPGCYVDQMSMELSGGILTGSFNFIGKNLDPSNVTVPTSPKSAPTFPVFNKVDNTSYLVNGVLANGIGFTLNLANNMRAQNQQMGSPYAVGVGDGGPVLGGTLSAYFENNNQLNDFTQYVFRSMDFIAADDQGRGYAWEIPQCRLLKSTTFATGVDTDILAEFDWKAMRGNLAAGIPAFRVHATEVIQ